MFLAQSVDPPQALMIDPHHMYRSDRDPLSKAGWLVSRKNLSISLRTQSQTMRLRPCRLRNDSGCYTIASRVGAAEQASFTRH